MISATNSVIIYKFSIVLGCLLAYHKLFAIADLHVEVIPIDHGICQNWTEAAEANAGNCSYFHHTIHCFGGMSNIDLPTISHKLKVTTELIFCGWPKSNFDAPSILKQFPRLRILRIEHSNLTHIDNDFPDLAHLESINISWTKLCYTRPTLFKKLTSLKFLDLRWNQLDHMEGPLMLPPKFESLYLAGNPWNCATNLKWLLNHSKGEHVADRNILKCIDVKYAGRPVLTVMQFKMNLKEACNNTELQKCSCTMSFIRLESDGHSLKPMYSINCSRLNLDRLPSFVPEHTTIFHATDNKITNVEPLKTIYKDVQDIYLDYNHIQSIDILESSDWLKNFRIFSLKGNKLSKLPVYIVDNALEHNPHEAHAKLYLSQNPWRCDCIFALRFQDLLMKYHGIIKDSSNVTCKYIEGDNNFGVKVLALKRTDVCKVATEHSVQPLDLLNVILGTLIILVLSKLAYDYYHYRKSGRLPWIVTKIP